MQVKAKLALLKESDAYATWISSHSDDYLVHFFVMMPTFSTSLDTTHVQIGFYSKSEDVVTSFDIEGESVSQMPPQEAFKKEAHIAALSFGLVTVDFKDGYTKALELQKEKYPGDTPTKVIFLLQQFENKAVYNITFITTSFNVLNVKISAEDGSVLADKKESLMAFKAPESD